MARKQAESTTSEISIGGYKIGYKTSFAKEEDEVKLTITVGDSLKELIALSCASSKPSKEVKIASGTDDEGKPAYITGKRYAVKKFIYGSLASTYRDILFLKELVDSGKVTVSVLDVMILEDIMEQTKNNVKTMAENILKYSSIDVSMTFKAKRES